MQDLMKLFFAQQNLFSHHEKPSLDLKKKVLKYSLTTKLNWNIMLLWSIVHLLKD